MRTCPQTASEAEGRSAALAVRVRAKGRSDYTIVINPLRNGRFLPLPLTLTRTACAVLRLPSASLAA